MDNSLDKYIIKRIPVVGEYYAIKDVLAMLEKKSNNYDSIDYIYVNNEEGKFIGICTIEDLFNNSKATKIEKIMKTEMVHVSKDSEIEYVGHLALKHDVKAIPVLDNGKIIGVISSREIISIVNKALKEDIFHFAGIHKSHLEFENSLEIPLAKLVKNRIPWLLIGLVGSMVIAMFISLFEDTLAQHIIIASFVPAVVYMSDALGTQLQTVFVRDLAILGKRLSFHLYLVRQMMVSLIIAFVVSILMFVGISAIWNDKYIAFVISLASFFSLIITALSALFTTLLIRRFKFDPALGSGPIATVISDLTSVVIYFVVVVIFL